MCGYGSGLVRLLVIPSGSILAEVTAHAGWITGMDLASPSGTLVTCAEDGFVRVSDRDRFNRSNKKSEQEFSLRSGSCLAAVESSVTLVRAPCPTS